MIGGPATAGESSSDRKTFTRTVNIAEVSRKKAKTGQLMSFIEDLEGNAYPRDVVVIFVITRNARIHRLLVATPATFCSCPSSRRWKSMQKTSTLFGFTGHSAPIVSTIVLPMTMGDEPLTNMIMTKFLLVKVGSAYDGIISRTSLHASRVVVSTCHQMLKFPISRGVGQARSNQN